MLSITTKSPYALKALTELAVSGDVGPVPIGSSPVGGTSRSSSSSSSSRRSAGPACSAPNAV